MSDEARMAKVIETRERKDAAGDTLEQRLTEIAQVLPADELRALVTLLLDELGYLGEHMPEFRESTRRFKCSGGTYHRCSYMLPHHQGCKAIGGDGNLVYGGEHATSCEADCDESAPEEPWCSASGFDCPTCEMVDALLGILARHGAAL